jgi:hypothetical protein
MAGHPFELIRPVVSGVELRGRLEPIVARAIEVDDDGERHFRVVRGRFSRTRRCEDGQARLSR